MKYENTKWYKWVNRNGIKFRNQPAVYYIAYTNVDISGQDFTYLKDIIYIGVTTSQEGLKGRLDNFENSMKGINGVHGGAERVRFKHKDFATFFANAYVSAKIFELSSNRNSPNDWRIKGDCLGDEYKSIATYLEMYEELPEFNDHKKSKKK
jgi:hypothetical protein